MHCIQQVNFRWQLPKSGVGLRGINLGNENKKATQNQKIHIACAFRKIFGSLHTLALYVVSWLAIR